MHSKLAAVALLAVGVNAVVVDRAETSVAYPTATESYPAEEPYPTQEPYPTETIPSVTDTGYPTSEPYPTQQPYPTSEPEPYPTSEPEPTQEPYPTETIPSVTDTGYPTATQPSFTDTVIYPTGTEYPTPYPTVSEHPTEPIPYPTGTGYPTETIPTISYPESSPTNPAPTETLPTVGGPPIVYPIPTANGTAPSNLSTSATPTSLVIITTTGEGGVPVTQTSVVGIPPSVPAGEGGQGGSAPTGVTQPGAGAHMQAGGIAAMAVFLAAGAMLL